VTPDFSNNAFEGTRWTIDVSGDGAQNDGANTASARDAFISAASSAGVLGTINGLPIGQGLQSWYDANIVSSNGFSVPAADFASFNSAVITKIGREITGEVPVPGTLALLGLGLFGAALKRRK
jgi:hypothetical protein